MNPHEGMVLGNRYTLTEPIASGGMGDVWKASDSVLGRQVAVKVMRPDASSEPTFADRFRDEARHTASLTHPNIATVYDYGEDGGDAYLVMELVEGEPLSQLITRGPMAPQQTRSVLGQAALALAAAHAAGVVHRDVKPANILLTPEDRVKLTDFGIARAIDSAGHTRTGEVLGTPHYLAPEQALGRTATGASDIYALGVVGHEMLTGRKPFDSGSAVATALAHVNDAVPPLPGSVPADLRRIVESCMAKDPAARPTSAAALAAALGMPVGGLTHVDPATSVFNAADTGAASTQVVQPVAVPRGATEVMPGRVPPRRGADPVRRGAPPPPGQTRRRSGAGWWWLPALVALAAIAFFVWQYASNNTATPTPDPTATVSRTTATPAPTTTPIPSLPTASTPPPTTLPPTTLPPTTPPPTTPPPSTPPPSTPPPSTPPPSTPPPTTPPPTTPPPTTPPPTTTAPPATGQIKSKDYVGKNVDEATAGLTTSGFTNIKRQPVASKEPAGTVTAVSPDRKVPLSQQITLSVSDGSATAGPKGPNNAAPSAKGGAGRA